MLQAASEEARIEDERRGDRGTGDDAAMRSGRLRVPEIATLALIVAVCAVLPAVGPVARPVPATQPASIVVIVTDDLDEMRLG